MLSALAPNNRLLSLAASEEAQVKGRHARVKRYGAKFATGFLEFYKRSEMADCTVVGPDGCEYRLHRLLLAYHSEYFRRLLSSEFKEGQARHAILKFEDTGNTWPILLEYFYTEEITLTDSNVLALFAASRELMIPAIQAVQYNCDQFRSSCVTLVAQSFNTCCFQSTDGLPVEVILEILEHPQLYVQTEEQVLLFVENYVRRHKLDADTIRTLYSTVRLPFLSNERLASLVFCGEADAAAAGGGSVMGPPKDLLLAALAQRLYWLDHPERLPPATGGSGANAVGGSGGTLGSDSSECGTDMSRGGASGSSNGGVGRLLGNLAVLAGGRMAAAPRKTYCCSVEYGLPGGSEYVSVPMEAVWDDLATNLTVRVSGETEGDPDSILNTLDDPTSWFNVTGDDPSRPVWLEVVFPPHMRVVELTKYTFSHGMNMSAHMFPYGISDSSWFQMKGMSTQVSPGGEEPFTQLRTQDSCQQHTEFVVTVDPGCSTQVVWRRLRIVAGEESSQQVRLSIRRLKLFGRVEVSLLREPEGRDVVAAWRRRKEAVSSGRQFTMLRGMSAKRLDKC
ncbi:hypothetical protein Vretimale_5993 [Volvox reticuliferus]|uniref:BTB domain-containing protein n=1 Tax=Volvox reticuliferus TaxID=1737510 RepID=A0A8J4FM53_9CHLO|nr:hypothetical protein Vretifemale_6156 [Volvox reticuliferus]GIM01167.1 hypothetical protein Vretimale_5993 [Volvox reticuliferus]